MKKPVLAATFLVCACTQPADAPAADDASGAPSLEGVMLPLADGAGNRLEALIQAGDRWCTQDSAWCVTATEGAPLQVVHGAQTVALPSAGAAWPNIYRLGGDAVALVGVVATDEQMYSGGSGSASLLTLYEVSDAAARVVAALPLRGSADVRACFDEDDERQRAGACRDMYEFVTRISLDETVISGPPSIVLETAAGSYPGRVTRNADSLEAAALQPSDLVWAADETCSYRRIFNRGADGLYAPDQPLPDCSDYLEP